MATRELVFRYSKKDIEGYENRCLANFLGVGGNISFLEFNKTNGFLITGRRSYIPENERMYLSHQPFHVSHCLKEGVPQRCSIDNVKCNLITAINLISLSSREIIPIDVRLLLPKCLLLKYLSNDTRHIRTGTINKYLFYLIKNAVPYITLKEVIQGLIQFIGNKHVYFKFEDTGVFNIWDPRIVRYKDSNISKYEDILEKQPNDYNVWILNGYFAENVSYSIR